jgi:hypothetical protein
MSRLEETTTDATRSLVFALDQNGLAHGMGTIDGSKYHHHTSSRKSYQLLLMPASTSSSNGNSNNGEEENQCIGDEHCLQIIQDGCVSRCS